MRLFPDTKEIPMYVTELGLVIVKDSFKWGKTRRFYSASCHYEKTGNVLSQALPVRRIRHHDLFLMAKG